MTRDQPPGRDEWSTSEFGPVQPPPAPPGAQQYGLQQYGSQQYGGPPYGYGPPPQKQGMSTGLIVALTLGAVVLVGLIVGAAVFVAPRFIGPTAAPATSTVSETVTAAPETEAEPETATGPEQTAPRSEPDPPAPGAPPPASRECVDTGPGSYSAAAAGNSVTSCEFARVVWIEYMNTGSRGGPATLTAFSPVTGVTYTMNCSGGAVVTCRGGNDAVVHIY